MKKIYFLLAFSLASQEYSFSQRGQAEPDYNADEEMSEKELIALEKENKRNEQGQQKILLILGGTALVGYILYNVFIKKKE